MKNNYKSAITIYISDIRNGIVFVTIEHSLNGKSTTHALPGMSLKAFRDSFCVWHSTDEMPLGVALPAYHRYWLYTGEPVIADYRGHTYSKDQGLRPVFEFRDSEGWCTIENDYLLVHKMCPNIINRLW